MTENRSKILLVDDHQMFREGIERLLELEEDFEVVGGVSSAEEATEAVQKLGPDIVIVDIRMPGRSGIDLTRSLRKNWPDLKIVVLSGYDFDQYVRALARIGIQGYLLKDAPQHDLVDALRDVARGGVALPPRIAQKVMKGYADRGEAPGPAHLWQLTVRELEILEHLSQGLKNTEIATILMISPRTVESHVGGIISKLGARTRTEAVRIAIANGLIV